MPTTPESNLLKDTLPCSKSHSSFTDAETIRSSTASVHRHHLSRPNSVSSLTGLELPQSHDEGLTGPFGNLIGNVRNGSILHYCVLSLLLFATISDIVFRSSSKPSYYSYNEDLSGEVLYPPYSNRGNSSDSQQHRLNKVHNKKNKGLLGSAMIQSVTEALGPILPFAGGVDLRRDENWKSWSSWLTLWDVRFQKSSKLSQRREDKVSAIPRGGGQNNKSSGRDNNKKGYTFQTKLTLSTPDPFLSTADISEMTLQEVSLVFQYAISSSDEKTDVSSFLKQQTLPADVDIGRMTKALKAVDEAVSQSRGNGVNEAITSHGEDYSDNGPLSNVNGYGDVDALKFCAAMRILAEWRVLRQVPPGFKGYAVGMTLGHKDVVQNVVKIETAIHEWIENKAMEESERRIDSECDAEENCPDTITQPRSPTLRQLLQFEVDSDIHPTSKLPRLKEKTAAMGLLWVRRQLHYQTAVFKNIISVPETFSTVIGAVGAAYSEVYGKYHGWTVQKIFNYSFQSAPDADLIFRHMNPKRLKEVEIQGLTSPSNQLNEIDESLLVMSDDFLESTGSTIIDTIDTPIYSETIQQETQSKGGNPVQNFFANVGGEVNKFFVETGNQIQNIGDNITTEWDKAICNVSKIFNPNNCENSGDKFNTRGGASSSNKSQEINNSNRMSGDELDAYISKEMAADAREHILIYLNVAVPLLNDLAGLFDELNMDDPSKV